MSILGSLVRVSPEFLERLREPGAQPYVVLADHEEQIDLERYWDVLRFLLDNAGVPVNPIRSGRPYPSAELAWGYDGNSCMLTVDEVRQVWHFLEARPFADIAIHLQAAADEPLVAVRKWDEEQVRSMYGEMRELFRAAATAGECTVFWAA